MKKIFYLLALMLFSTVNLCAQDVQPQCATDSSAAAIIKKTVAGRLSIFQRNLSNIKDQIDNDYKKMLIRTSLDMFLKQDKTIITYNNGQKGMKKRYLNSFLSTCYFLPFSEWSIKDFHYFVIEYNRESKEMKIFKYFSSQGKNTLVEQVKDFPAEAIRERINFALDAIPDDSKWFYSAFLGDMELQASNDK